MLLESHNYLASRMGPLHPVAFYVDCGGGQTVWCPSCQRECEACVENVDCDGLPLTPDDVRGAGSVEDGACCEGCERVWLHGQWNLVAKTLRLWPNRLGYDYGRHRIGVDPVVEMRGTFRFFECGADGLTIRWSRFPMAYLAYPKLALAYTRKHGERFEMGASDAVHG